MVSSSRHQSQTGSPEGQKDPFMQFLEQVIAMELPQEALLPALSIGMYFGTLTLVLSLCLWRAVSVSSSFSRLVFLGISLTSLYFTWSAIFSWLATDVFTHLNKPGGSVVRWIIDSDLFNAAYVAVTQNPHGWWWSVQLLNFTATFIVFAWTEGSHRYVRLEQQPNGSASPMSKKRMAPRVLSLAFVNSYIYVILGFIGAISVGFPLLLVQRSFLTGTPRPYSINRAPWPTFPLMLCILLSLLSIFVTPYIPVDSPLYGWNLKTLHLLLLTPILIVSGFSPVLTPPTVKRSSNGYYVEEGVGMAPIYAFIAGVSLISHVNLSLKHFIENQGTVQQLLQAVTSNPCQFSITADLFFATIVSGVFMLKESVVGPRKGRLLAVVAALVLFILSPVLSVSVTFPTFLAYREAWRIGLVRPRSHARD